MKMRTDTHRPSQIVPADYEHVMFYNLATMDDGWPIPSFRVNCESDRAERNQYGAIVKKGQHDEDGMCCLIGMRTIAKVKFASHGTTGQCTVCGTHFVYGEVWKHIPTAEYIHIGHICAGKYNLLADYSEFELQYRRFKKARAVELQREKNKKERGDFLEDHPGLEQALETDHHIVQDIKDRFFQYRNLSEKQIALVFKLASEAMAPKYQERLVPAPTGRQTFTGVVIGTKLQSGYYEDVWKMIVKVETGDGCWKCFGTIPSDIRYHGNCNRGELKGTKVEITATLTQSDDAHFAFFKRPRGKVIN